MGLKSSLFWGCELYFGSRYCVREVEENEDSRILVGCRWTLTQPTISLALIFFIYKCLRPRQRGI
ncbi:hypothetical protein CsSME_00036842 [Camellia sinensis var. sinensis]